MSALWAVVPAAGSGARMGGDIPKQYLPLAGACVLEISLRALLAIPGMTTISVALQSGDRFAAGLSLLRDPRILVVSGAAERSGSVLAGLEALRGRAAADDWVLVHDAARPCVRAQDIAELVAAVSSASVGGLLAEAIVDTVKQADGMRRVVGTLDRSALWLAQTPQMFRYAELVGALEQAHARGLVVTDEAAAMEMAGYQVQLVQSSRENIKITRPADLPLAEFYLAQREANL